jgi:hypothetical protein
VASAPNVSAGSVRRRSQYVEYFFGGIETQREGWDWAEVVEAPRIRRLGDQPNNPSASTSGL